MAVEYRVNKTCQLPSSESYERGFGRRNVEIHRGPETEMRAKKVELEVNGYDTTNLLMLEPGHWEVGASFFVEEDPEETYELDHGVDDQSLFASDVFAGFNPKNQDVLRKAILEQSPDAGNQPDFDQSVGDDIDDLQTFYSLYKRGFETLPKRTPIVRRTIHVAHNSTIKVSKSLLNKVVDSRFFGQVERISTDVLFTLDNDQADASKRVVDYTWGYLKTQASATRTSFNRFALVEEWEYGRWPDLFFPPVTSL